MAEKKLTLKNAVLAKCWECMGYYEDGKTDCRLYSCPLYNWMPQAEYEPITTWLKYNPKRVGKVTWEQSARKMTDEQKEELRQRLLKMHKKAKKAKKGKKK